jgi:hypothetical protein
VNFAEAIGGAGGSIVNAEGKPTANSREAGEGLIFLADYGDGEVYADTVCGQAIGGRTTGWCPYFSLYENSVPAETHRRCEAGRPEDASASPLVAYRPRTWGSKT